MGMWRGRDLARSSVALLEPL
ncbi:Protein of unknown function [Pyronema omphalodes CBS 100304]|uniref:Uncharacterized protein n=1 Tax=Pyronema omphalodes (strain CBS 100304) TaxID=1076935 RepID=U4LPP4_PYROM|nr:Protein of unknown function [Pyronema omphalodes CBS 100304]